MTMPSDHLDDERVSAALDGDTPREVAVHLAACLTCRERLDAFARVRTLVSSPERPLGEDHVDRLVSRAIAEGTARPAPAVVDLAARRAERRPLLLRGGWVAAAAAVFALLVGVPALLDRESGDDDAATTAAPAGGDRSSAESAGDEEGASNGATSVERSMAAPTAGVATDSAATGAPAPPIGAFDEPGPLVAALRSELAALTTRTPQAQCEAPARSHRADLGALVTTATLEWRGQPAVALVFANERTSRDDDYDAVVTTPGDCVLLVSLQF